MAALGEWHCIKRNLSRIESFAKDNEDVPEAGCLSIIVLGASGDLAKKKTFPALFNLYRQVNHSLGFAFNDLRNVVIYSMVCLNCL